MDRGFLARKLGRMVADAIRDAQNRVADVQREANLHGAFGGSRMYLLYDKAVGDALIDLLPTMAKLAFEHYGKSTDQGAAELKSAGISYIDQICTWVHRLDAPGVPKVKTTLMKLVDDAVDDFNHGFAGGSKMKSADPVTNVVQNTMINSPGGVQQAGVGNFSQSAFTEQHSKLIAEIDKFMSSPEVQALGPDDRNAVGDIADALRAEAAKEKPDAGRLYRWGSRLSELAKGFGVHVAAAGLWHILGQIFSGGPAF